MKSNSSMALVLFLVLLHVGSAEEEGSEEASPTVSEELEEFQVDDHRDLAERNYENDQVWFVTIPVYGPPPDYRQVEQILGFTIAEALELVMGDGRFADIQTSSAHMTMPELKPGEEDDWHRLHRLKLEYWADYNKALVEVIRQRRPE